MADEGLRDDDDDGAHDGAHDERHTDGVHDGDVVHDAPEPPPRPPRPTGTVPRTLETIVLVIVSPSPTPGTEPEFLAYVPEHPLRGLTVPTPLPGTQNVREEGG